MSSLKTTQQDASTLNDFMAKLDDFHEGWTPSETSSKYDVLVFIEKEYEAMKVFSKFGIDKRHGFSEQMRFGTALIRAGKVPRFHEFIKEFRKTEILLNEDQSNFNIISRWYMMPKIIRFVCIKGETVGINYSSVVNQSPKYPIHPHGINLAAEYRSQANHGRCYQKRGKGRHENDKCHKASQKYEKYKPREADPGKEKGEDRGRKEDHGGRGYRCGRGHRSG